MQLVLLHFSVLRSKAKKVSTIHWPIFTDGHVSLLAITMTPGTSSHRSVCNLVERMVTLNTVSEFTATPSALLLLNLVNHLRLHLGEHFRCVARVEINMDQL